MTIFLELVLLSHIFFNVRCQHKAAIKLFDNPFLSFGLQFIRFNRISLLINGYDLRTKQ